MALASRDRSVRAAAVDAADRRGGWTPDVDARMARLESPVRAVIEPALESGRLDAAERITIVPDAHYPFHPSTGTVTDPAVVGAIIARLGDRTDADVAVAGVTDELIDFDRTAGYLGYDALLERFGADLVDLAAEDEPRTETAVAVDDRTVSLSVPERLVDDAVVTAPTLRPTETGAIAGGMRRLADFVNVGDGTADDVAAVAATRAADPALSVMDATVAYGGDPYAANALFAGSTPAVDALGSSLLERSVEDDDALALTVGETTDAPITLERVGAAADALDIDAIRERIGGAELPPSDDTHPAVTTAYRLYAAVGGDAVPPQLEQGP